MPVTVEHLANGTWRINFPGEEPVILPADSKAEDVPERGVQYGDGVTYLEMEFVSPGRIMFFNPPNEDREIMPGDDMEGERERAFEELEEAWDEADGPVRMNGEMLGYVPPGEEGEEGEEWEQEAEPEDPGAEVPKGGRKKKTRKAKKSKKTLRLKKQARRTKRNVRNNKGRKSRKLTTRRR